jgi:hypothetical protein
VSAPKANEESRAAPRMLKLTLTDGHTSCQAVELESVQALRYTQMAGKVVTVALKKQWTYN